MVHKAFDPQGARILSVIGGIVTGVLALSLVVLLAKLRSANRMVQRWKQDWKRCRWCRRPIPKDAERCPRCQKEQA